MGGSPKDGHVQPLFKDAKQIRRKRPNTMITYGEANFHNAFKKEFFTINNPRTRHISHIHLQGDHNNNKMERLNGEEIGRKSCLLSESTRHQNSSGQSYCFFPRLLPNDFPDG
jgi:hypothetical protein